MVPKLCPSCGADVEGLIYRCDLCGALLNPKNTMFSWMVYDTGVLFDIHTFLNQIFDKKLDSIDPTPYAGFIQKIEFDIWGFPIKKKAGVAYYSSRKQAIITVELDVSLYIHSSAEEKLTLLTAILLENLNVLQEKLVKKKIDTIDLFPRIQRMLNGESPQKYSD